jgi:hypothetical protein
MTLGHIQATRAADPLAGNTIGLIQAPCLFVRTGERQLVVVKLRVWPH